MRDGIETACHTRRDGMPHPSALRAYTQRTPFVYLRMFTYADERPSQSSDNTQYINRYPDTPQTHTRTRRAKVLVLVIADTVLLTDGMPLTAGHLQFARRVLLSGLIN